MPVFRFTARDTSGQAQSGQLAADSASALSTQLRGRGWLILDVQPAEESNGDSFSVEMLNPFYWMPPAKLDIEIGFQQIASMLRSGLTLLSAIKTASEQARRPSMGKIWKRVYERIEEGSTFAKALAEHSCFSHFVVQLVNVGEQSGTLDDVLTRAADHLERSRNLRMTLLNALMYPAIVFVMAVGVAAFMVLGVIPKLQTFIQARNRKLPPITQLLLDVSTWIQNYLPYLLIGFITFATAVFVIYKLPAGRKAIDTFVLRVPLIGGLLRTAGTALFARSLGLMLQSGITLLEALGTVEKLISNRAISLHIGQVREHVMQGGTLADPLTRERKFMPMLGRMVAVGETTGTLDPVLHEVADYHEKDLAASVRRYSVLIEPVVIIVVGGIVGFVYIAFFVALFSLAG